MKINGLLEEEEMITAQHMSWLLCENDWLLYENDLTKRREMKREEEGLLQLIYVDVVLT